MRIEFRIDMTPFGQGRPRARAIHLPDGRAFAHVHKAGEDRRLETTLAALAARHRPADLIDGPIVLRLVVVNRRPAYLCKIGIRTGKPLADPARRPDTRKPDVDNVVKGLLDALKDWWRDDAAVVEIHAEKWIAGLDEIPHYEVTIAFGSREEPL